MVIKEDNKQNKQIITMTHDKNRMLEIVQSVIPSELEVSPNFEAIVEAADII
jgi:hypothetical protein